MKSDYIGKSFRDFEGKKYLLEVNEYVCYVEVHELLTKRISIESTMYVAQCFAEKELDVYDSDARKEYYFEIKERTQEILEELLAISRKEQNNDKGKMEHRGR